jgi:hypothetical protein
MEAPGQRLADVLAQLRGRIDRISRRRDRIGEQNTKAVLIEPLLSALGWDLLDLSEVIREYRHQAQDSPVDYALFILRSPRLFVEAKDLGANLGDRRWVSQILGYATVVGVEWCVLTNGDEYHLYNAHAPVGVDEKLFRTVKISEPSQEDFTLRTLDLLSKDKMGEKLIDALWKAHFIDRHVKSDLEDLLTSDNRSLVRWIRRRRPELTSSEIRESLQRAEIQIEFPVISPISPESPKPEPLPRQPPKRASVQVSDLIQAGLVMPPMELEKRYKGTILTATVQQDGSIVFEGQAYNSLSTAAGMARKSIIGAPPGREYPQTNGWTFWRYRDSETGVVEQIDALRQQYLETPSRERGNSVTRHRRE